MQSIASERKNDFCKLTVLNIGNILKIKKCSTYNGENCESCEYCILQKRMMDTKTWYSLIGRRYKLYFMRKLLLLCNSNYDLLHSIEKILEIVNRSDSIHSLTRSEFSNRDDPNYLPKDLTPSALEKIMLKNYNWFKSANMWSQINYLLSLLEGGDLPFFRIIYSQIQQINNYKMQIISLGFQSSNMCQHWPTDKQTIAMNLPQKVMTEIAECIAKSDIKKIFSPYPFVHNLTEFKEPTEKKKRPELKSLSSSKKQTDSECRTVVRDEYILPSGTVLNKTLVNYLIREVKNDDSNLINEDKIITKGAYLLEKQYHVDSDKDKWLPVNFFHSFRPNFDFISLLPKNLQIKIFDFLESETLMMCMEINPRWKSAIIEILERQSSVFPGLGKSKKDLSAPKKEKKKEEKTMEKHQNSKHVEKQFIDYVVELNPNFATDIYFDVQNELIDENYKKINNTRNNLESFNEKSKISNSRRVLMEIRNIFCTPYKVINLLKKRDFTRVIHHDGNNLIVVLSMRTPVRFYSLENLRLAPVNLKNIPESLRCIQLVEKDHLLFGAGYDTAVRCWSIKTGVCCNCFFGFTSTIFCLSVCNDYLAAGSQDGKIKIWDIILKKLLHSFTEEHPVTAICITDLICISGSSNGNIRVYSTKSGQKLKNLNKHLKTVTCIRANHWFIISSSKDTFARVWNASGNTDKCLLSMKHPMEVTYLEFLYLRILTSCWDGIIRLWNLQTGDIMREIYPISQHNCSPILSFHAGKTWLVINTLDNVQILSFKSIWWIYTQDGKGFCPIDYDDGKSWIEQLNLLQKRARVIHQYKNARFFRYLLKQKSYSNIFTDIKHINSHQKLLKFLSENSGIGERCVPLCRSLSLSMIGELQSKKLNISIEDTKHVLYQQYHWDRIKQSEDHFIIDIEKLESKDVTRKCKSLTSLYWIENGKEIITCSPALKEILNTEIDKNKTSNSIWKIYQDKVNLNSQIVRRVKKFRKKPEEMEAINKHLCSSLPITKRFNFSTSIGSF